MGQWRHTSMPLLQGNSSMTSQGGICGGYLTAAVSMPWDVSLVARGVWTPWENAAVSASCQHWRQGSAAGRRSAEYSEKKLQSSAIGTFGGIRRQAPPWGKRGLFQHREKSVRRTCGIQMSYTKLISGF